MKDQIIAILKKHIDFGTLNPTGEDKVIADQILTIIEPVIQARIEAAKAETAREIFNKIESHDLVFFPKPNVWIHWEDTQEYQSFKSKYTGVK